MPRIRRGGSRIRGSDGGRTRNEDCCCGDPVITPCSGSTLLINRADYEIHLQFHSGSYTNICHTCAKLEATTFILTWDATRTRWGYTNATFGDACSTHRRLDIGLVNVCSSGVLRLAGRAFDDDDVAMPDEQWFLWGLHGNAQVCLWGGRWSSVNTTFCTLGTNLSIPFPAADVTINTWYEFGALDTPCDDLGDCDCRNTSVGLGTGPQVRVMFVEA